MLLKLTNGYFDREVGFDPPVRRKATSDTSILIGRTQNERNLARRFDSPMNAKPTAFVDQDRAALSYGRALPTWVGHKGS